MFQRKPVKDVNRRIWRMSPSHPEGEYVSTSGCEPRPAAPAQAQEPGLRESSFELSTGAEVLETAMDTLPGELICEFTKSRR